MYLIAAELARAIQDDRLREAAARRRVAAGRRPRRRLSFRELRHSYRGLAILSVGRRRRVCEPCVTC